MDANAAMGIIQRVGLSNVRHTEADVIWSQKQQARRLLPRRRYPVPQKPSDMCTKSVPAALTEQHLAQLNLHYAEGRAAVAQKLRTVGLDSPELTSSGVSVLFPGFVGCRTTCG